MFSNVQQNKDIPNVPPVKYCKKQNWPKSSEIETTCKDSVLNDCHQKLKNDLPAAKLLVKKDSLVFQSLLDVTNNYDNCKETIHKNDRTQSTFDLTDNAFNNHSIANKTEFSTLPRKSDAPRNKSCETKSSSNSSSLSRALSFSGETKLHSRSQSLVDVGSKYTSTFLKHEEARRSSLAALSEQRKKGMSKLRGLVIPEKVIEVPTLVVDDLPVIKSNDCPITNNIEENITKVDNDKFSNSKLPNDKHSALITSSPWKTELTTHNYEIPKYSPAFKRKSLSLYGTSSCVSSVSSSLSSSREELRNCFYDTSKTLSGANTSISRSLASLSRNPYLNVASSHSEPKSLESITSPSISDLSNDYGQDSVSPNLNNETLPQYKYNEDYASDGQQSKNEERGLEEESDNDSAVSSSRSSISPPHSPMPCTKKNDDLISPKTLNRYDVKLKRSLSSETTASNASSGSTLTSGSQASSSSTGGCLSMDNKRVLKPQSVEAINRKNVLSSAKFSSGTDLKHETPDEQNDIKDQLPLNDSGSISENQEKIEAEKEMNSESNLNELNDNFEFNLVPVNGKSTIEFSNFHSPVENDQIKNHNTELIKCETSFNIEDFTYSSHKNIDKNSNVKINNFNDFPDGIMPNENTNKWNENSSGVEYVPIMKMSRPILQIDPNQYDKQRDERENIPSPQGISVNNMKKVFEKVESILVPNTRFKVTNQNLIQHPRIPSVDSTNSDDSCIPNLPHYGSASNLQKEQQFGSITSLASSTSLISQQVIQFFP